MFQADDQDHRSHDAERKAWMALLARAPQALLEQALSHHLADSPEWLRRPESGLMMVQGRAGGTGERFNLGEITVTRCALRLARTSISNPVGVAYVLGRSHRHAHMAALADALLQDPVQRQVLEQSLLAPVRAYLQEQKSKRQQKAQTTKVDFLTIAREASQGDHSEQESV